MQYFVGFDPINLPEEQNNEMGTKTSEMILTEYKVPGRNYVSNLWI